MEQDKKILNINISDNEYKEIIDMYLDKNSKNGMQLNFNSFDELIEWYKYIQIFYKSHLKKEILKDLDEMKYCISQCRECILIVKAIHLGHKNNKAFVWVNRIKNCLLYKFWSILFDLFQKDNPNVCSFSNILKNIEENYQVKYKDNATGKNYLIKKEEVLKEVKKINKEIIPIISSFKHSYNVRGIRKNNFDQVEKLYKEINEDKVFSIIKKVDKIFKKISILLGSVWFNSLDEDYCNTPYVEFIAKFFNNCQPK